MKLLIVMRPVAGGMWEYLRTLLPSLREEYEPLVCCQEDPEQFERLASEGLEWRVVKMPPTIRPGADLRAFLQLRRLMKEEKPDLIHTNGFHEGLLVSLAAPFAGRPAHVCTLHNFAVGPWTGRARRALYLALQHLLVRRTDRVITVCDAIRRSLPGADSRNVVTILNGVSEKGIAPRASVEEARRELGLDPNRTVVGSLGRLAPEKSVDDFVRLAARFVDDEDPPVFLVVGDGPERERLADLSRQLRVDALVRFTGGRFPGSDYMQLFDVTVIPSVFEGCSLTAIESMFLGIPVVATAVGGLPELVSDETGRLVPVSHPKALESAVRELLASPDRERIGANARRLARQRFTSQRMVQETMQVFRETMEARRR